MFSVCRCCWFCIQISIFFWLKEFRDDESLCISTAEQQQHQQQRLGEKWRDDERRCLPETSSIVSLESFNERVHFYLISSMAAALFHVLFQFLFYFSHFSFDLSPDVLILIWFWCLKQSSNGDAWIKIKDGASRYDFDEGINELLWFVWYNFKLNSR